MTLDLDKYAFTDGATPLSAAELNTRFYGIVRRLHALELLSIDWSTAIAQVQNYGLARINDAVQPLIDSLKTDLIAVVAQGEAALVSQSAAVDAKLVEVDTQMAAVQAAISEALASQSAAVDAKLVEADAQMAVMQAAANAALVSMAEHEERRDNPHEVTARMIGALALDMATEVPIAGAVTLTSAAFGKMHVCTGTTADYPLGLPAAAGNAGKLLGIRIGNACTKLVTLDGNASELIDGALTRVMWAGESAILLCDGVGWTKIAGKSIPMVCKMTANAVQSIPSGANTRIRTDVKEIDNASIGTIASNLITTRRAGFYVVMAHGSMNTNTWQIGVYANGGSLVSTSTNLISAIVKSVYLPANTACYAEVLQSSGAAANTATYPYPYLSVQEVVQW